MKVAQSCLTPGWLLCPWGFSRQEYWSSLPCPPPGNLSNPGIKLRSSALQADSLLSETPRKPSKSQRIEQYFISYICLLHKLLVTTSLQK